MKQIITDCSIVANWVLFDELNDYADSVLAAINEGAAIAVPSIWLTEITNVLLVAERRGRINKKIQSLALKEIQGLPIKVIAPPSLLELEQIVLLAARYRLTSYDAEYLRVAVKLNIPLATLDKELLNAAINEGVALQFS